MHDDPPAGLQRAKALPRQKPTLLRGPVMEDHPIEVKIGGRERGRPEIAPSRGEALLQPVLDRKLLRHFTYCGSVQPHPPPEGPTTQGADTVRAPASAHLQHNPMWGPNDPVWPGK